VLSLGYAVSGNAATVALQGDFLETYWLKDGRVYTADNALDCAVSEVPAGIGGEIRYWSVVDPTVSDWVDEEETGVWFFSSKGVALRHVPLESADECQGVFFSPVGSSFLIQKGSGMNPDVTFDAYGEAPEKITEFSGILNEFAWVDSTRFVLTRIDGTRENPNYEKRGGRAFGLRTSIVMFDTAAKETVVCKEASATQNFWFTKVIEGGKALEGWEQYVESENDWGDEEKELTRDIRIEVPGKR
jgi:hypothetical protein